MDGAPVTHEQLRKVILAFMDSPEFADDRRRLEFFDRLLEAWRRENEQGETDYSPNVHYDQVNKLFQKVMKDK